MVAPIQERRTGCILAACAVAARFAGHEQGERTARKADERDQSKDRKHAAEFGRP